MTAFQKIADKSDDGMFGPGTDMIVSLLGVFVILVVAQQKKLEENQWHFQESQMKVIQATAEAFHTRQDTTIIESAQVFRVATGTESDSIFIQNGVETQRFYFGENILFQRGESAFNNKYAIPVLNRFGEVLKQNARLFKEIQIQGHASDDGSPESNLTLATNRACAVYNHFVQKGMVNPAKNLISVVSFGEYKPVDRPAVLPLKWKSKAKRAINRRIEIIIIYLSKNELQQ